MSHPHCYVDIAFPLPLPPLTYTNNLADSSLQVGSFARARLRNKSTLGIVTSIHSSYQGDTRRLKPIESIEPISPLPSSTLDLAYWIASYYGCSWGESLFSCFPTYPENRNSILFKPFKISNDRDLVEQWVDSHQRSKKACSILNTLLSDSIFYLGDLKKEYGSYIQPYLKQWQEQQIIVPYSYTSDRKSVV